MSYCRGIVYLIQSGNELCCMSPWLHAEQFNTPYRSVMLAHLAEHIEDAEEIHSSVDRASKRLREESRLVGDELEKII